MTRELESGDVLYAAECSATLSDGTNVRALSHADHDLVLLFLGTRSRDDDPNLDLRMANLGWTPGNLYQLRIGYLDVEDLGSMGVSASVTFSAKSPVHATIDGIRWALANHSAASAVDLHAIKIGPIDENGSASIARSGRVFAWSDEGPQTLDEIKDQLCAGIDSDT